MTLATEFTVRRAQHRLNGDTTPVVDEDDYWIWGQFYYNPNSRKAFINERVGMGMSMNFATPAGKAMAVFTIVILVALLPLCGWLISEELSVTTLTYSTDTIAAQHGSSIYEVPIEDVMDAELLEELPSCFRIWGTGMENLLKGSFSVEGYGTATFCLNPNDPPFLVLKTAEEIYFFSGTEAEGLFEMLNP